MGKLGHLLDLGQFFTHGLSSVYNCDISGVWVMAYSYGIGPNPCHLNFDFNSYSGMCA